MAEQPQDINPIEDRIRQLLADRRGLFASMADHIAGMGNTVAERAMAQQCAAYVRKRGKEQNDTIP